MIVLTGFNFVNYNDCLENNVIELKNVAIRTLSKATTFAGIVNQHLHAWRLLVSST
jgi:hypothetical protein